MKHLTIFIALLLSMPSASGAQDSNRSSYFPMELGNWWLLAAIDDSRADAPPDTFYLATRRFVEELSIDQVSYYRFSKAIINSDTLRADAEGRIWSYAQGEERLLFDYTAEDESIYSYSFLPENASDSVHYSVHVRRDLTVVTYVGAFDNCIRFSFDIPEAIDDEISYTFAPDVGLVMISGAWEYGVLFSAQVGSRAYATAIENESELESRGIAMAFYPNPIKSEGWLEIETAIPGQIEVSIYDMLGRKVQTVVSSYVEVGMHRYRVYANSLAKSVYFIHIEHDRGASSSVLMLRH